MGDIPLWDVTQLRYEDASHKEELIMLSESNKERTIIIILFLITVGTFILSCTVGRYAISVFDIFKTFYTAIFKHNNSNTSTIAAVLFNIRIPRIFAAMLIGAALSMSGAAYQGLFRNPMVSPDILGASAGAGFGASLAILLSFGITGIQISSFLFGIGAVALTYIISAAIDRDNNATLVLVLSGMVVSTLFSSFVSMIKYVADPYSKLPAITFWLMGGLSSTTMDDVKVLIIPVILGTVPLILFRYKLNVLSFGEEEAKALGVDTKKIRLIIIVCSTLLTASSVSVCGMIGWIGLIIPHLSRMLVGPNYKFLLPTAMLLGCSFLLIVDDIARTLFTIEIPLGILTAIIGAPFFIYLLVRGRRGWV